MVNFKAIGSTLTAAELNAYASLLQHNKTLTDQFKLKNGVINGVYGNYEFDLSNASIVDNGILITDETLSNNITVKLSNATQYATYTLHFTVVRYGDVNILEEPTENIESFDLSVDLIADTIVNIPLDSLQEYDVILFNSNITIQHNKPEIIGKYITALDITANNPIIQTQETSILEITATDLEHLPMPNKSIQLLKNNTLLDTLTTDSQGKCSYTYTGVGDGLLNFIAKYRGLQSEIFVVTDALFYDTASSSASVSKYYTRTDLGNQLSYVDNVLVFTVGTSYTFVHIGGSSGVSNVSDYTGKLLKFEVDVNPSYKCRLRVYQTVNGTNSHLISSSWVTEASTISLEATLNSNATAISFRLDASENNQGETVTFKNWKIYSI